MRKPQSPPRCKHADARTGSHSVFIAATGVNPSEADFDAKCIALIVLRLLEAAETFRLTQPEKYQSWDQRLRTTLPWWEKPLGSARS